MRRTEDIVEIKENSEIQRVSDTVSLKTAISDIGDLIEILYRETTLLNQANFAESNLLMDDKNRLISRIELFKNIMIKNPAIVIDKTEENISEFKKLGSILDDAAKLNFREVMKAREVNKRVVEAVSKVLEKRESPANLYNKKGIVFEGLDGKKVGYSGKPNAIAFNQTV